MDFSKEQQQQLLDAMEKVLHTKIFTSEDVNNMFKDILDFSMHSQSVIEIIAHITSYHDKMMGE